MLKGQSNQIANHGKYSSPWPRVTRDRDQDRVGSPSRSRAFNIDASDARACHGSVQFIHHFSNIAQPAENALAFWNWHCGYAEGADEGAGAQALEADGHLPGLGVLQDEDEALAFLVAQARAQDVKAAELAVGSIHGSAAVDSTRGSAAGEACAGRCEAAGVLAGLEQVDDQCVGFLARGHRVRGAAAPEGEGVARA